eukprot:CAMPEP_0184485638 /NCGR_PEP_ID=MMETSP0113_2-20130426/7229_1 /TAXON_ID=91329 /ORGANISM="Norrisiella sphaerica, Strain BC52" /LENGTH=548 /DNA_ID=CAMNT_0026867177 /DNA_START=1 /DNA_END=1645 /DNA_ORIENTATION=-
MEPGGSGDEMSANVRFQIHGVSCCLLAAIALGDTNGNNVLAKFGGAVDRKSFDKNGCVPRSDLSHPKLRLMHEAALKPRASLEVLLACRGGTKSLGSEMKTWGSPQAASLAAKHNLSINDIKARRGNRVLQYDVRLHIFKMTNRTWRGKGQNSTNVNVTADKGGKHLGNPSTQNSTAVQSKSREKNIVIGIDGTEYPLAGVGELLGVPCPIEGNAYKGTVITWGTHGVFIDIGFIRNGMCHRDEISQVPDVPLSVLQSVIRPGDRVMVVVSRVTSKAYDLIASGLNRKLHEKIDEMLREATQLPSPYANHQPPTHFYGYRNGFNNYDRNLENYDHLDPYAPQRHYSARSDMSAGYEGRYRDGRYYPSRRGFDGRDDKPRKMARYDASNVRYRYNQESPGGGHLRDHNSQYRYPQQNMEPLPPPPELYDPNIDRNFPQRGQRPATMPANNPNAYAPYGAYSSPYVPMQNGGSLPPPPAAPYPPSMGSPYHSDLGGTAGQQPSYPGNGGMYETKDGPISYQPQQENFSQHPQMSPYDGYYHQRQPHPAVM